MSALFSNYTLPPAYTLNSYERNWLIALVKDTAPFCTAEGPDEYAAVAAYDILLTKAPHSFIRFSGEDRLRRYKNRSAHVQISVMVALHDLIKRRGGQPLDRLNHALAYQIEENCTLRDMREATIGFPKRKPMPPSAPPPLRTCPTEQGVGNVPAVYGKERFVSALEPMNLKAVPTTNQGDSIMARTNKLQSKQFRELTGAQYIDESRCSGRTTALALIAISVAITRPNQWHVLIDHFGSPEADLALLETVKALVQKLGLKFFVYTESDRETAGRPAVRCDRLGD